MITSENSDTILEAHFQSHKKRHCLDRVVASVDVVTHEQVVGVRGLSSNLEKLAQIMELSVDVTADGHWGAHLLHVRLINQDFLSL